MAALARLRLPYQNTRVEACNEIWIAEDNADVCLFLWRAFNRIEPSLNLIFFRNGAELVDHFHAHPVTPRLLLLDMEMPVMGGLDTLEFLHTDGFCTTTPVVIFSSLEHPDIIRRAYASGAKLYMKKPANLEGFNEVAELCVNCAEWIRAIPAGNHSVGALNARDVFELVASTVPKLSSEGLCSRV